ncbi:hypothetical protein [Paeniglutamicibacter antarcticus]|uniref:Uncharacterized protein n=1 Tax=Paeniglutamicibacter antarcticus TaxID=494023 RepID=A0ABP9TR27_9MICC
MPAESQASRPKKSRRFTAPPQKVSTSNLLGVFELPHGAGRPSSRSSREPEASAHPDAHAKPALPGKAENHESAASVLEQRAAEDDPRRWGDGDDDLGDWMKSQRPPHWD